MVSISVQSLLLVKDRSGQHIGTVSATSEWTQIVRQSIPDLNANQRPLVFKSLDLTFYFQLNSYGFSGYAFLSI